MLLKSVSDTWFLTEVQTDFKNRKQINYETVPDLGFQALMFGEQQMDSGEIVANFGLGHNVTHFFDPILFLCHIPVKLPKLSGFFQTGSTFHCQTYKFSIGIFQTWKTKQMFQTSFD